MSIIKLSTHCCSSTSSTEPDGVPIEMIKQLMCMFEENNAVLVIHNLILQCWTTGTVPQSWKDANITPLFKKGIKTLCDLGHLTHWQGLAQDPAEAHLELR